jgi:anthranilate synthase component 1
MVLAAKEYIAAGDIFQVVLSQRLSAPHRGRPVYHLSRAAHVEPVALHVLPGFAGRGGHRRRAAAADRLQPGDACAAGGRLRHLHPIAGTRWRGKSAVEDAALAEDLLADPKERAEHVMLVDLGRNDLGRVCEYGSVTVPVMMAVERYSHVMHIVSDVRGKVRPSRTPSACCAPPSRPAR